MSKPDDKLKLIAAQLKKGTASPSESVRSFLLWFDAKRRGYRVVRRIRNALKRHGLSTIPDFEWTYIDAPIVFQVAPPDGVQKNAGATGPTPDPTYLIGSLPSANRPPIAVSPDATLQEVVTVMMVNDFSQLPVMTSPRELKGAVSWKTIGTRLALNRPCAYARECMEETKAIMLGEPLFAAITAISAYDYALIQAPDKIICGIVTASDLNIQFKALAEPFLLLGEIENGVRRLLHGRFTVAELQSAKAPGDEERVIDGPADLSLGEYVRLIENKSNWNKLKLPIDRASFIAKVNGVRDVRNDVMHFNPDGLDDLDLELLREAAQFLRRLRVVGAG